MAKSAALIIEAPVLGEIENGHSGKGPFTLPLAVQGIVGLFEVRRLDQPGQVHLREVAGRTELLTTMANVYRDPDITSQPEAARNEHRRGSH